MAENNFYISPSDGGFYQSAYFDLYAAAGTLPDDLIELAPEHYEELYRAKAEGKGIVFGADGAVSIGEITTPASDVLQSMATARQSSLMSTAGQRIGILNDATDPDIVDMVDPADVALLKLWKQYRVALSKVDLTRHPVKWPATPADPSATV